MDRLLSEEELEQAGASVADPWLELAAEANDIGFFNWDVIQDKLRWNRGAEERMGLARGTISSFAEWRRFVHPTDAERVAKDIAQLLLTQSPRLSYHYRFTPFDGQVRFMEGTAQCLYDKDGILRRMMGVNMDVTKREHDKRALGQSEVQMRTIVETVPDAMIIITTDGIIKSFNHAAELIFGWREPEVVGRNVNVLMPASIAAGHDRSLAIYLAGGPRRVIGKTRLLTAQRADGTQFPIELNVGEAISGDEHLFTGFIRDVSERAEASQKLEDLRGEFLRAARLTAMGEMAAGLAHELNQPLSAAANYLAVAELKTRQIPQAAQVVNDLHAAAGQIARTGDIIRRLRSFLSSDDRMPHDIAMSEVIGEALALALAGGDRNRIAINISLQPPDMTVFADRVQVQQVLVNVIRNAVEALDEAGTQRMRVTIEGTADGAMASFNIDDTGSGFPERILRESHMPFVSTKGEAGMGLGLSISRRIIEMQHGALSLANREDGGARVTFTLPLSAPSD